MGGLQEIRHSWRLYMNCQWLSTSPGPWQHSAAQSEQSIAMLQPLSLLNWLLYFEPRISLSILLISVQMGKCGWDQTGFTAPPLRPSHWSSVRAPSVILLLTAALRLNKPPSVLRFFCSPGHFLLFQVRENSSQLEAFIQSASLPRPVSSTDCQVRGLTINFPQWNRLTLHFCSLNPERFFFTINYRVCFQLHFSLYLYGDFNGTVQVAVIDNDTATSPLLWERSGRWNDKWQDITLQLPGLHHGYLGHNHPFDNRHLTDSWT